jgi:hypothetical protein
MRWDWVHLVCRPIFGQLYEPLMIDDNECGAVGGMRTGRGNRSTRRKSDPVPLCPPQIPHYFTWARTQAAEVWSRRLTTWAKARPCLVINKRVSKLDCTDMLDIVHCLKYIWDMPLRVFSLSPSSDGWLPLHWQGPYIIWACMQRNRPTDNTLKNNYFPWEA